MAYGLLLEPVLPLILSFFLALGLLWQPASWAKEANYQLTGKVVNVSDGDTVRLLVGRTQHRIRLASIDAPETGHGKKQPGQPYAKAARDALAALVAGKEFTLVCYEQDRYQRDICDIPLPNGQTANRVMVASGMAWANMQGGGKYLRDASLPRLQKKAQQQGLGLWRDPDPISPWQWRWSCWAALEKGQKSPICAL